MTPLRLVLVSRRFWPLLGGAERVTANLAAGFCDLGCQVTILTAQWDPTWPGKMSFGDARLVRLPQTSRRFWGTLRYMRALGGWLRDHRGQYDLVYVSMLKHDAFTVLGAVGRDVPVVLRAEGAGVSGDCRWQAQHWLGRLIRRRCRRAAALVAPSPAVREELLAAGYPAARVLYVPNGVQIPPPRKPEVQRAARHALAETHPAMFLPRGSPLAVYTGRLHEGKGLDRLLTAWKMVSARWPLARLWLAGDGPKRAALERQITALRLHGNVLLPGSFDSVEDFLAAADLFVFPSREEGMSLSLLEAMGAGLPLVASDIPGNRALVENGREGLLVPVDDAEALAAAIERLLEDQPLAVRLGQAARQRAAEFTLTATVQRHLALFASLRKERARYKMGAPRT